MESLIDAATWWIINHLFLTQVQLHVLAWGFGLKFPLPSECRNPIYLTQCISGPHKYTCEMASKSVKWSNQGARLRQTDRQTDRQLEQCVAVVCSSSAYGNNAGVTWCNSKIISNLNECIFLCQAWLLLGPVTEDQ